MRKTRTIAALIAAFVLSALGASAASAAPAVNGEFDLGGDQPGRMTLGPDGNVWAVIKTSATNKDLARVKPDGTVDRYDSAAIATPVDIAVGPDGNLWVTDATGVAKVPPGNPEAGAQNFPLTDVKGAQGIVTGSDGNLWAANGKNVIKIPPTNPTDATVTTYPINIGGQDLDARGVALGGDGNVWVADAGGTTNGRVISVTTGGTGTAYNTAGGVQEVAAGPNKQIVYSNPLDNPQHIGRVMPGGTAQKTTTPMTDPFGIAFGTDGAYWIAQFLANKLGRLTPDGQYTQLAGFSPNAGPRNVVAGPNNTLWVALEGANKIARVTGVTPPAPTTPQNPQNPQNPQTPADKIAPVLSRVSLSATAFYVGSRPTAVAAARRRIPTGTTIRYTLSEAAAVRIVIARKLAGRRRGRSCVRPTRALRRARRCTRYSRRGVLTRTGKVGANSVRFSGRIGRRALAPGAYRLTVGAKDAAGNSATVKRVSFRVLAKPRKRR